MGPAGFRMNAFDFRLLVDENIAPELVLALRDLGTVVCTVHEWGLVGASDAAILDRATREHYVVLTHDSDFGLLAVRQQVPFVGIIYLRRGHANVAFSLESLATRRDAALDLEPPFLLVVERRNDRVLIRLRREP
jgi:predicted nuclease of predicted toxin-antitoxin system